MQIDFLYLEQLFQVDKLKIFSEYLIQILYHKYSRGDLNE